MAGIGFELKKAVNCPSSMKRVRGYAEAAFSCSGSMIVGIILFCMIQAVATYEGLGQAASDMFMCYVTNAMFVSMVVAAALSLSLSRYVSDMLYLEKPQRVAPSLAGSIPLLVIVSCTAIAVMCALSGLSLETTAALIVLESALVTCWTLMTYVTLLRDYRQVVRAYLLALMLTACAICLAHVSVGLYIETMILLLTFGFGVVDAFLFRSLTREFMAKDGSLFGFFVAVKKHVPLVLIGLFVMVGFLGHFWITRALSSDTVVLAGAFCFTPDYDFPAIAAYLCTVPATIYFVTFFETDFSEVYSAYFDTLENGGTLDEVTFAKQRMIESISKGMTRLFTIQIASCLLFVTVGGQILAVANIGMTSRMLSTFRMFCVGYSFYYVGNCLLLIHLYFANEKKVLITSAIYALLVIACTSVTISLVEKGWGAGFAIASLIFAVVLLEQLLRYLKDLERNILCSQPLCSASEYDFSAGESQLVPKNPKSISRRTMIVSVAIICISVAGIVKKAYDDSILITFYPGASSGVLRSPGIGLAPWAENQESLELDTTLVYVELKWSEWEPEPDVYDVEYVINYFNLETYREQGRQVVFRFICDEPTEEEHMDIPEWLYGEIDGDGDWYETSYGKGFSPNYENEALIERHALAIAALGEEFGSDDFFIFVELGSLGHWGEWHVNFEEGVRRLPSYKTRKEYIQPYLTAFPNTDFLLRYPLVDATENGFGLYNDMTGDYEETVFWLEQMSGGVWEQTNLEEQTDTRETWKTKPVGGEFASSHSDREILVTDLELTIDGLRQSHQSFIGPKIIIDDNEEKIYQDAIDEILKTIGYRYRVSEASIDFAAGNSFVVTMTMVNEGIAPVYQDYVVRLSIQDGSGDDVWVSEESLLDLRNVLPDQPVSASVVVEKSLFDDDEEYNLVVAVEDDSGSPVLPLAMADEVTEMVYFIGKFSMR
jgi:uncharacterized membrane protein